MFISLTTAKIVTIFEITKLLTFIIVYLSFFLGGAVPVRSMLVTSTNIISEKCNYNKAK